MEADRIRQSADVEAADWIGPRLSPFNSAVAASVIPNGFAAYARVLHPLRPVVPGEPPARWADVARWSGVELTAQVQFPDIAFPEHEPTGAEPWPGQVPVIGTLDPSDRDALAALLASHTGTPDRCRFCVWEGWGPVVDYPGPRVELPCRRYVLFTGPLSALPSLTATHDGHAPSLWWPEDRAWCVASEIDLAWTYVGGRAELIAQVLADPHLEAQPAVGAEDLRQRLPEWLRPARDMTVDKLLATGTATLRTWRGAVHGQLERPRGDVDGDLSFQRSPAVGRGGRSWHRVSERDPERLRENVTHALAFELSQLLE